MKTLLYIDATPDNAGPKEVMQCLAKNYGYRFECRTFHTLKQFEADIKSFSQPIDILYIAAHGCKSGISLDDTNGDTHKFLEWTDLASVICESQGLNEESTVYLACCDGGFKRAALVLMAVCPTIEVVAGLPCKLEIQREALAFHTFTDHLRRFSDASRISNAVSTAIDQQFSIFVRHEMDVEIEQFYQLFLSDDDEDEDAAQEETVNAA